MTGSANYTVEKGRTHSNIFERATGEYVCQLKNKEVAGWLIRAEKAIEDHAWFEARRAQLKAERHPERLAKVQKYLASRAARGVQLNLI